jgi:hypothetical protein
LIKGEYEKTSENYSYTIHVYGFFLGFIYVPYDVYYPNGAKKFVGHHLRVRLFELVPWEKKVWGQTAIDANLIIAEILAITAVTVVIFILFKRDEQ